MAQKPKPELFPSYLRTVKNSIGSNIFRNLYFRVGRKTTDILNDGDLSCAYYVTSILYLFGLIRGLHTTVSGTVGDLQKSGWRKIKKPREGAIILWDLKKNNNGTRGKHRHVGFYINSRTAISNNPDTRIIARHHPTFGRLSNGEERRNILAYYWNGKLRP